MDYTNEFAIEKIEFHDDVIVCHYGDGIGALYVRYPDLPAHRVIFNIDELGNRMRRHTQKITVVTVSRDIANTINNWMDAILARMPELSMGEYS